MKMRDLRLQRIIEAVAGQDGSRGGGVMTLAIAMLLWSMSASLALALDAKQLYRQAAPAVVYIQASGKDRVEGVSGTGSIIRSDGYILTNAHVVASAGNPLPTIVVALKPETLSGQRRQDLASYVRAELVARSDSFDLALLKIDVAEPLPALRLSDLTEVAIGEDVIAIGHPGGGVPWTMTAGRLSGTSRDYRGVKGFDVLQTDTAINPGNSGGPLLDSRGEIVGINTFGHREGRAGVVLSGLNFAVQSTTAVNWLRSVQGADFLAAGPSPRLVPPVAVLPPTAPNRTPEASVEPDPERAAYVAFLDELRAAQGELPEPMDRAGKAASEEPDRASGVDGFEKLLRELRR